MMNIGIFRCACVTGLAPGEIVLLVAPEKSNEKGSGEAGDPNAAHNEWDDMDRRVEAWLIHGSGAGGDGGADDRQTEVSGGE